MKKERFAVACANCVNLEKSTDKRGWTHYTCKYAKDIEWLGGFCRDPLNPYCGKYKEKPTLKSFLNSRGLYSY